MSNENYKYVSVEQEETDFREIIDKYLKDWRWFAIITIIACALAYIYLQYTTTTYKTVSSIIIINEDNSNSPAGMSAFADLNLFSGMGTNSIANELGLLRSKRLMTNTVKALKLNVGYFEKDGLKVNELYNKTPLQINILRIDDKKLKTAIRENRNMYELRLKEENTIEIFNLVTEKSMDVEIGEPVEFDFADFVIHRNKSDEAINIKDVKGLMVEFNTVESITGTYKSKLEVDLMDENSTLVGLSMVDPVREKAQDILDQIIFEYNREAIEDKNLLARSTASFIDERLQIINKELDSVETGKEAFKEAHSLTNIDAESTLIIQNASDYNVKQQEVSTQLELINAVIDFLHHDESDLLPSNLGIEESGLNQMIEEFNTMVLERNRILAGSTERNPVVIRLNNQIDQLKSIVMESFERRRSNLKIAQNDLERQSGIIGSKISRVPAQERQFRGIERQQNIKEALYLFLLQKREENSLSLAATAPKAKLVDQAYSINTPVSPNPKVIFAIALLSGLLIPFLIINAKTLLNNKARSREDIEKITKAIPIIGEVPHMMKKNSLIQENDRSLLSEAFRILITNIQYLLVNNGNKRSGFRIFVTSSIQGEGKTFTAINLAITLAKTNKKVVVVGADLRNPQLHNYEKNTKHLQGVSNYLADHDLDLNTLIKDSQLYPNLKILTSGTIPPNPSELLALDKEGHMFSELEEKFDYIIVDTAPSMLLADTFLINKYSDMTVFMVRAGYTKKKLLNFPIDASSEGKLTNIGFVLNDVKINNFSYGNDYGYRYGDSRTGFWARFA